ncbi:uncharacterized protein K02A2.6-like [Anneissia japonica]|uniref:uncharacterized protein K02A2.6-like n=1 Tax=Anneissia japonica TaxID=1529436 RepID=UPI0014259F51|nr:uncharacterized protein K02A2.6-like [Anneissia japonica]
MSKPRIEETQQATVTDDTLQQLSKQCHIGWPDRRKLVPVEIRKFWPMRDEIYEHDRLLFMGHILIVPASQQEFMLYRIHDGHLGMEKSKARELLYWPGISSGIESLISKCSACTEFKRKNQREPMILHELPKEPFNKVGANIFHYAGNDHLIVVDYYSNYPEVVTLCNKTAKDVICKLKSIFARHSIPEKFISDNMPFASWEMKQFAKSWGKELITSSTTYAQSNGQAE